MSRRDLTGVPGARRARLPAHPAPQLATLADAAPTGDDWLHELKFDGYRILAAIDRRGVRCLTRSGHDWADRMPGVAAALAELAPGAALVDGELCVITADGTTSFQRLQQALGGGRDRLTFVAFDLLHLDGWDLRGVPLVARKAVLADLLPAPRPPLHYSDHVVGGGDVCFRRACELGLEGIISKRADAPYAARRSRTWLKVKCARRHEVVIGGFTEPRGGRAHLGALLVGTHDDRGRLVYRGKVGTGFSAATLRELHARLAPLERTTPPFVDPPRGADARGARWVAPRLLAEVAYTELTTDGRLRHPRFKGLRDDKPARGIVLE